MNYEEEKRRYISFCGSYWHLCERKIGAGFGNVALVKVSISVLNVPSSRVKY